VAHVLGFRRLLVANRGEIARRIFRTAHHLGLESVAVFADDDRDSPYVHEADQAIALGSGPLAHTYLDGPAIIAAALGAGADAIHPGYGFLSEDAAFAEACSGAGLIWVGPPAKAMAVMGHKAVAKETVAAAGVPVLAGVVIEGNDPAKLSAAGKEVGFPLLVKASAGGGGRGMRLVEAPEELEAAVDAARREAQGAFGSDEVFLERYVVAPRHVEVQVIADRHGNVLHLFDRECSIQRRHQKVIEEAPATLVSSGVRSVMWEAAVNAARAVGYEGAGTVEFIVDGENCAFLEMNTRLQVEHGVTELICGIDLVELQLLVASGQPLPMRQEDLVVHGHAIEARLCAERPREDYRPTPGPIHHAAWPIGAGVRVDAAVETGSVVTSTYDNLIAKVMTHAESRQIASAKLARALRADLELDGIETNRSMLVATLESEDYLAGETTTDFLGLHPEIVSSRTDLALSARHAIAAGSFLQHDRARHGLVPNVAPSWHSIGRSAFSCHLSEDEDRWEVTIEGHSASQTANVAGPLDLIGEVRISVAFTGGTQGVVELEWAGVLTHERVRSHGHELCVSSPQGQSSFSFLEEGEDEVNEAGAGECRAPLPGSIAKVLVALGDQVEDGTGLVVLEAMKMEHTLRAAGTGIVAEILAAPGDQVDVGQLLVRLDPSS
jgi:acetyl/propionyl-CoA carboxylase alpha subunit